MNKEKRIWLALFLALTLMVILSGCSGLPKTAKLNISIDPNPIPYDPIDDDWPYTMILSESNGVGVTVLSRRYDRYTEEDELYDTDIYDAESIINSFGTNYIPAFSSIQNNFKATNITGKYAIITVTGVDDKNNTVTATIRVDYLSPQ
jgi:hypothetical protein